MLRRVVSLVLAGCVLAALLAVIFRQNAALEQQTALTGAATQQNVNIHKLAANIAARLHLDPDQTTVALLADIEKQIGPRQVSAADSTAIANTLLAAGAFNFQIDVLADDPETRRFARELFNTLLLAGWVPANTGLVDAYTDGAYDVVISAATKIGEPAAYTALSTAFAQAGIATLGDPGRKPLAPPGTVEIFVGDKP